MKSFSTQKWASTYLVLVLPPSKSFNNFFTNFRVSDQLLKSTVSSPKRTKRICLEKTV